MSFCIHHGTHHCTARHDGGLAAPLFIPLVYVAGPYRGTTAWEVEQNVRRAEALGYRVAQLGAYPVIPHTNTRQHFEHLQSDEFWLQATLNLLATCHAAVFTSDYERSSGARAEREFCKHVGTPWFVDFDGGFESFATWLRCRAERERSIAAQVGPKE